MVFKRKYFWKTRWWNARPPPPSWKIPFKTSILFFGTHISKHRNSLGERTWKWRDVLWYKRMKRILSRIPNCENSQVTKTFSNFRVSVIFRGRLIAFDEKGNETFCMKKIFWKFLLYIDSVALRWVSAARVSAFIRAGRNKYFSGMGATFGKNVSTILVTKQPILHE